MKINRRKFLQITGAGSATLFIPISKAKAQNNQLNQFNLTNFEGNSYYYFHDLDRFIINIKLISKNKNVVPIHLYEINSRQIAVVLKNKMTSKWEIYATSEIHKLAFKYYRIPYVEHLLNLKIENISANEFFKKYEKYSNEKDVYKELGTIFSNNYCANKRRN